MTNEVIVRDHRIEVLLGHARLSFEEAVADALHRRDVRLGVASEVRADHEPLDPAPEPADPGPAQTPRRLIWIVAALVMGAALLAATLRVKDG